jgi:RNA polymerase sigma factor (TIGR02999 family)
MPTPSHTVTDLLHAWAQGDSAALDKLVPVVYEELRHKASRFLRRERPGHSLQTTDLVHEAYLRLVGQRQANWQNRAQFFGIAAQIMRRVLIDHARSKHAAKRGGKGIQITLDDATETRLTALDPQQAKVVELRYFTGLGIEETAQVLGISAATVKREWVMARAWLRRELSPPKKV